MRPVGGRFATLKGLVAENPEIDAGFVKGGLVGSMQGRLARSKAQEWQSKELGKLRSVGRLFYEPIWVFVRSDFAGRACATSRESASSPAPARAARAASPRSCLRANGIEVSKETRYSSRRIWRRMAISSSPAKPMRHSSSSRPMPRKSRSLLHTPGIRLMNFAIEADAYANRFPALTKVMLNRGAVEFDPLTPPDDITLLSTSVALVVRADLEPSLMTLLSFAVMNNPRSGLR